MAGEKSQGQEKNIFEIESEEKLRELAIEYWRNYHLSHLSRARGIERGLDVKIETAHEAYERYLERLENLRMLPSEKITKIVREVQEEAFQDAVALVEAEEKTRISGLN